MKKKTKWQVKREKDISKRSQFDPKIHELARQGEGFGMKRDYKSKPGELSGRNLPFKSSNESN